MSAPDDAVNKALDALREVVAERVRAEQLADRLTGLPNKLALSAAIHGHEGKAFWLAFIEVDRFKAVNAKFGHDNADLLLQQIARTLDASRAWFGDGTIAVRAHGDEFFLLGRVPREGPDRIAGSLATLREAISRIRVPHASGEMQCTVSVGWVVATDAPSAPTEGTLMDCLERAVAAAKRKRNDVRRYDASLAGADETVTLRGDCTCGAAFSLDIARASNRREDDFWCPNCGERSPRDPEPQAPPPPPSV